MIQPPLGKISCPVIQSPLGPANLDAERDVFRSEILPTQPLRLKIEINTREHFSVLGHQRRPFRVASPWFTGDADIVTYQPDELCATKLRALYQRSKGRDLFDLARALERQIVSNLHAKIRRPAFRNDTAPLLPPGVTYGPDAAYERVMGTLIDRWPTTTTTRNHAAGGKSGGVRDSTDHNTKRGLGSAEDDSDAMCSLVIGKHDAEVAVEGDAIDRH
jgi:hypothetical protein